MRNFKNKLNAKFLNKNLLKFIFVLFFVISFSYSTSYQQFRHFDIDNRNGLNDTRSYIQMSKGNYNIAPHHRYRFIVPSSVSFIKPAIEKIVSEPKDQDNLAFYVVNFTFISIAALFLFYLIEEIGLPSYFAFLGVTIFLGSRTTIIASATPLVDSIAILATIFVIYTTYSKKNKLLTFMLPVVALTRDSSYPLLIIPLFSKKLRSIPYFISLTISFLAVAFSRNIIDNLAIQSTNQDVETGIIGYLSVIYTHSQSMLDHFLGLFTLKGIHDISNGFSFFLLFGLLGYLINKRNHLFKISNEMHSLIPIGFLVAMYSGNMGRIFFHYAFPTVIIYALIFSWWFINKFKKSFKV